MKAKLLVIAICLNMAAFSQTKTIQDLTEKYKVSIPSIPSGLKNYTKDVHVAVIPITEIGKTTIHWNESQSAATQETENEFETDLYKCASGKDSAVATTKKKPRYCLRIGYEEGAMGHTLIVYYAGIVKGDKLINIELPTSWVQCLNYGDNPAIKKCQQNEKNAKRKIEQYFDSITRTIKIAKR